MFEKRHCGQRSCDITAFILVGWVEERRGVFDNFDKVREGGLGSDGITSKKVAAIFVARLGERLVEETRAERHQMIAVVVIAIIIGRCWDR